MSSRPEASALAGVAARSVEERQSQRLALHAVHARVDQRAALDLHHTPADAAKASESFGA